ncbi:MAG: lysophospholipid acyltransferase family protein, partial [Verrucomicrobiota bacterium]
GLPRRPISIVAEDFKNPALTPIFSALRSRTGHRMIPQERAMIRLLKVLKKGGQIAFLSDLPVKPDQSATVIECFGMKTSVTILHSVLARRTGLPIVGAICFPREDGGYLFRHLEPWYVTPEMTEVDIAQRCWDMFEPFIREQPEHWIWMYKHWRYLPPGADKSRYPSYARERKAFSELFERVGAES